MNFGEMKDKAERALDSDKGEQYSDQALEKGEQFADEKTGGKYDEQIQKAEQAADQRIGEQGTGQP
jgi:hypothetical protein